MDNMHQVIPFDLVAGRPADHAAGDGQREGVARALRQEAVQAGQDQLRPLRRRRDQPHRGETRQAFKFSTVYYNQISYVAYVVVSHH